MFCNQNAHKKNKEIILLTSCVNPAGMIYTALQDPNLRLAQYRKAIAWYIKNTNIPIVIVDNSGYDYSEDFKDAVKANRLEALAFFGNNYDKKLGKGYGEAKIIRYAIENSAFIQQDSIILKITGRLIIKNINAFFVNNLKIIPAFIYEGKGCCDSYFFAAPVSFFSNFFLNESDKINDAEGYFFEHHLFIKYMQWKHEGRPVSYLCIPLIIDGYSGTTGKEHKKPNLRKYISSLINGIANYMGYCKMI